MPDPADRIQIITGDITTLALDAIVNAANTTLLGGGGVDGAIHQAAGPLLLKACRILNGCDTGQAKITSGYNLPAKHVIHTVGPVWQSISRDESSPIGEYPEDALLASCYTESLKLAADYKLKTIAFCAISTGVYRFPKHRAATIALRQTLDWLSANGQPCCVTFCCFSEADAQIHNQALFD